jgi:cytidine deaminase
MPAPLSASTIRRLETAARAAAKSSYSPYSKFRVGAAVLSGSGRIYAGSNVENASYGLCNCAERTAIFTAIAAGERTLDAVVVYTPTAAPTMPCGACRQVMYEFGAQAVVIAVCDSRERLQSTMPALLPHPFGPEDLTALTKRRIARRLR